VSVSACVLVSGGIESTALLFDALSRYEAVTPVYVRNHLRWEEVEIFWLKKVLRYFRSERLKPLKILELTMRDLYENHWSVTGVKVPGSQSEDLSMYLPGRNIILLSKAAVYAAVHGISSIEIGILKSNPFSDSSRAFFARMSGVFSMGLGRPLEIKAPLRKLKKEDVLLMAKKLPLECTFSCVNPKGYDHCGGCNKCTERKKAFFAVGIADKTKYKKTGM